MPGSIISQDHHPTLRHEDREAIGAELQGVLVTLIDLSLLGKQAHWNIVGRNFRALHLQLDELIDAWRLASDAVAERAVALGYQPDGRSATVAERSELEPLPEGQLLDSDVVAAFTRLLTDAIGSIRDAHGSPGGRRRGHRRHPARRGRGAGGEPLDDPRAGGLMRRPSCG